MTATLFYVIHNPNVLHKLQQEIRTTFQKVEEIRIGTQLKSCRYLRACLDEAMRLTPSSGGLLPREVLPGGLQVDGEFFPAGTDLGVPTYAVHHMEDYYPQPFAFRPERWIVDVAGGVADEDVTLAQSAFSTFSLGPRGCAGKTLAYLEMMIVLARMIHQFDFHIGEGCRLGQGDPALAKGRRRSDEFQTYDRFVASHDGPMVQFRARPSNT